MSSNIFAHHLRTLSKATALVALSTLVTACSNDAARFDQLVTASVPKSSNQQNIINGVRSTNGVRDDIRMAPSSQAYKAPVRAASKVSRSALPAVSYSKPEINVVRAAKQSSGIPSFPKVPTSKTGLVLSSRSKANTSLRTVDGLTTGSVKKVVALKVPASAASKSVGWKNNKGSWVTVKKGETLYNMSRRYGVPVMAIMSANKISDANSVSAGQRVLIPTYNYASTAPVSAPDSNPVTKASRSSRGFQGQARGKVALPKARIQKQVAVSKPQVTKKISGGTYTVQSGDTLYGLARKYGVSTASLRSANNLSGNGLQMGQRLTIPAGGAKIVSVKKVVVAKAKMPAEKTLDKIKTGSIGSTSSKVKSAKPIYSAPSAPSIAERSNEKVASVAKTSAGKFRWPARGRLIAKFGEKDAAAGTNNGIDISMPVGTPVKASENGTVIYSGSELEDFGKLILVSHSGGWVSAYAHVSSTLVRRGDKVNRGQVIAKSGKTGNATTPMLHFELRKKSRPVNPLAHLSR